MEKNNGVEDGHWEWKNIEKWKRIIEQKRKEKSRKNYKPSNYLRMHSLNSLSLLVFWLYSMFMMNFFSRLSLEHILCPFLSCLCCSMWICQRSPFSSRHNRISVIFADWWRDIKTTAITQRKKNKLEKLWIKDIKKKLGIFFGSNVGSEALITHIHTPRRGKACENRGEIWWNNRKIGFLYASDMIMPFPFQQNRGSSFVEQKIFFSQLVIVVSLEKS